MVNVNPLHYTKILDISLINVYTLVLPCSSIHVCSSSHVVQYTYIPSIYVLNLERPPPELSKYIAAGGQQSAEETITQLGWKGIMTWQVYLVQFYRY